MICIGVIGSVSDSFINHLGEKYTDAGYKTAVCNDYEGSSILLRYKTNAEKSGCDVFIADIAAKEASIFKYDILIFITADENGGIAELKNVKPGGYVIINTDDCSTLPYILPKGINIITCGVNSRAAVTFSAIDENKSGRETIQCCVQSYIKTLSGRIIEPQEFGVNILGKYPISEVLTIITTAITGDIEMTVTSGELFSQN